MGRHRPRLALLRLRNRRAACPRALPGKRRSAYKPATISDTLQRYTSRNFSVKINTGYNRQHFEVYRASEPVGEPLTFHQLDQEFQQRVQRIIDEEEANLAKS